MAPSMETLPAEVILDEENDCLVEEKDAPVVVEEGIVDDKLKQVEDELKLEREQHDGSEDESFKSISYSKRVEKLDSLLEKAGAYSKFLMSNMEPVAIEPEVVESTPSKKRKGRPGKVKDGASKLQKINENQAAAHSVSEMKFKQPSLFTGGTLRSYQLEGIQWMCNLFENGLNGILADEMGLGKTVQVIGMLAQLKAKGVRGPYLVVAPLSTLSNWYNEFKKFTPTIPAIIYHGNNHERKQIRMHQLKRGTQSNPDFPVIITSYEVIIRDASSFNAMGYTWKFMIIDEGHRLKNMNCLLMKELKKCRSENRLLLSGTPLQNNLSELWSLLNFLLPDVFDDLALFQTSMPSTLRNMAMQLRKCCNHPYMFDEDTDASGNVVTGEHLVQAAGKLQVMDSMLKQLLKKGHKVLIFSQMTRVLDILEDFMLLRRYQYCRLDGQTHFTERQRSMDAFNDPNGGLQIFLLSTRAGGLGINLTGADTVILYDSDWNPHQDNQAQDRCHRIGQTKDVVVYRLITENSFENRMLQRANAKRTLERVVLSRGEFSSASGGSRQANLTMEELESLLQDDIQIRQEATGGISEDELAFICDREQKAKDITS
ncbi:unnamed protein product [Aphanomyces euteiches]